MNKKTILLISFLLIPTIIITAGINYLYFSKKTSQLQQIIQEFSDKTFENQEGKMSHPPCLAYNEQATIYPAYWHPVSNFKSGGNINVYVIKKGEVVSDGVSEGEIERQVKEKNRFNFLIPDAIGSANPPEIKRCGVYAARQFNFDFENLKTLPGFRKEIWRYQYDGKGEKILTLSYKDEKGIDQFFYNDGHFAVDQTETYIALEKSWLSDPNYAIIIKNLETMDDVFEIKLTDLVEKYNIEPGIFTMSGWDEKRFGFQIHAGAIPVFTIEKGAWKIEKVL